MIDAKAVAERAWVKLKQADLKVGADIERIIAEEIDAAQNPKPKTRGEAAASKMVQSHEDRITFRGPGDTVILARQYSYEHPQLLRIISQAIDAECAAAVKEERERCAKIADDAAHWGQCHKELQLSAANIAKNIREAP